MPHAHALITSPKIHTSTRHIIPNPRPSRVVSSKMSPDVYHLINRGVSFHRLLTPEEWNNVKLFATAKNILSRYLPLALSDYPVLDANSLAGARIGPAGSPFRPWESVVRLSHEQKSCHPVFQLANKGSDQERVPAAPRHSGD
jgi:hypothetical protein